MLKTKKNSSIYPTTIIKIGIFNSERLKKF